MKCLSLKQRFEPYTDIFLFMVTLLIANFFWKLTVVGDECGDTVTWFGLDISAPFQVMTLHVASAVYWVLSLFKDNVYLIDGQYICFDNGVGTMIVWGCSGIKQAFIWLCLILTVRGGWLHKLWFIPFGWLCCYIVNILRIACITLLIENHPTWFPMLHDYIFKYLFYAILFGLWVLFVEKIRPNAATH